MRYLVIGCEFFIGAVFLHAFVGKARTRASFTASVRQLGLVPARWVGPVSIAVVVGEGMVPLLLIASVVSGRVPAVLGLATSLLFLLVFILAIVMTIRRGVRAPCHCFGRSETPLGVRHLIRNLVLALVAAVAIVGEPLTAGHQVEFAIVAVAGAAGVVLATVTALLDDLVALFAPAPLWPHEALLASSRQSERKG